MDVWLSILLLFLIGAGIYVFWKHTKRLQRELRVQAAQVHSKTVEIQTKDADLQIKQGQLTAKSAELQTNSAELQVKVLELQAKETEVQVKAAQLHEQAKLLEHVKGEKATLEAKYQKKVRSAEEKKKHLAKYHEMKKDTRSLKQQVEDIVGKGPKWLPHSCTSPRSHRVGKPLGSRGAGRPRPEKIHESVDLFPITCITCNTSLETQTAYFVYDTVVTELSRELDEVGAYDVLHLRNICHRVHRRKCPKCGRWVYPDQGLFKNARFGVGFICYVISQRIALNLTYADILRDMQKIFGLNLLVSETAMIDWFVKFENQIQAVYAQLEELVRAADFAHVDETGLPMMGENWWLWVVCTANLVLYHQSTGRGHSDIQEVLKGFEGTIIADFFRAYEKFDSNPQQKCLAHLLSAIIELMVKLEKENERTAIKIQKHGEKLARDTADAGAAPGTKKRGRKPAAEILTPAQLTLLERRHAENLKTLTQAEALGSFFRAPFQDTCFSWKKPLQERISPEDAERVLAGLLQSIRAEGIIDGDLENLVKRCEKFRTELFTYLQQEGMPPDNNRAERNLRKFAKQRKVSGDFKSPEVGKHFVAYLSLHATCDANGRDFDHLLKQVLSGDAVDLRAFLFPTL